MNSFIVTDPSLLFRDETRIASQEPKRNGAVPVAKV